MSNSNPSKETNSGRDPNSGHGHVYKRPDGVKARCGGPALCSECALDMAALQASHKPQALPSSKTIVQRLEALKNPNWTHYNDGWNQALNKAIELIRQDETNAYPTWQCPNCGAVDEFNVQHDTLPNENDRVVIMITCRICELKCTDGRSETSSPEEPAEKLCDCGEFCNQSLGQAYTGTCRRWKQGLPVNGEAPHK